MGHIKRLSRFFCLIIMVCVGLTVSAKKQPAPYVEKNGNQATLVRNNTDYDLKLTLYYEGRGPITVDFPSGISREIEQDCYKIGYAGSIGNNIAWSRRIDQEAKEVHQAKDDVSPNDKQSDELSSYNVEKSKSTDADVKDKPQKVESSIEIIPEDIMHGWSKKTTILNDFEDLLASSNYYSLGNIQKEKEDIDRYIEDLNSGVDKSYVEALCSDTVTMLNNLEGNRNNAEAFVAKFLDRYPKNSNREKTELKKSMLEILDNRLNEHEENLNRLQEAIQVWEMNQPKYNWRLIGLIAGIAAICAGLLMWFLNAMRKNKSKRISRTNKYYSPANVTGSNDIVVRRKTTSILKKQSLENVIDNPAYLAIDCADFCTSSAVRRIYIKNACIKDIYNMYAEDLRNPENPQEDGCMVLGRWVHDKENNEYYVSLEDVVMPGDDAVFSEYELNFGGKIKLKVSEKLRKLRRETDLQYDMTCWVHSHPGLGVFFSNQDNTVHMQLKHPTHPHFLTALVIDILTPEQELGIFTFKPDGNLNSKADLTKMYSLEDMYKWAIESERNTFKREDHFDTLAQSRQHEDTCHGVHLSNSAVIDIDKLAVEHENGMAGMVHGFVQQEGSFSEIAVSTVCQEERIPDNEPVGCFIITKYCSIPTVRRAIEPHVEKIRFALVYSTADGLLTTIPIRGKELITDEAYYGEQKLEELKIWTRRKR